MTAVQRALARMRQARSVDAGDDAGDELARAGRANLPVFIAALRDRSHLVKGVAVEWLAKHGGARAVAPLEQLIALPSMIKASPGMVKEARKAIRRLRANAR